MGAPGVDVKLSGAAQDVLPVAIECKFTEKLSLWRDWAQAIKNARALNPVLIHRKSRTKAVAIVDLNYLLTLHAECDKLAKLVLKLKEEKPNAS